eukprot:3827930-Pleurochrysis_carterae.AAC.1
MLFSASGMRMRASAGATSLRDGADTRHRAGGRPASATRRPPSPSRSGSRTAGAACLPRAPSPPRLAAPPGAGRAAAPPQTYSCRIRPSPA